MLVASLADSPNPQFSRPTWRDQSGEWRFRFDDENVGLRERWYATPEVLEQTITVPYSPESLLSGVSDRGFHRYLWYARELDVEAVADGEHLILHFGAVDFQATVWVDGAWVGSHRGGQTPFSFDVTDALAIDASSHWVVVRAEDNPEDIEQPRGKQDWQVEPHIIWYHRTSGIWQPVWTEVAPSIRVLNVRWRFDAARWLLDYEVELSDTPTEPLTLTLALDHEGTTANSITISANDRVLSGQMGLGKALPSGHPDRVLWNPDRPNLVGITVTLSGGAIDDVVQSYTGLRTIDLTGRRFRINGRDVFLRFVLNQGYWPESQLTAPTPDALRKEVELILALGFNGARNHQKIEDPRFLYWADRLGLMLWGETANAFTFTELAIDRHIDEWRDAVIRDRNHPSVIAWVPFNESWGVGEAGRSVAQQQAVHTAYHRTHTLDGTRPVVGNDGWDNVAGDLVTIHDYSWKPETLRKRYARESDLEETKSAYFPGSRQIAVGGFETDGKPVMVTEYGGVSFAPDAGEDWFGYGKVRTAEEFAAQYKALTDALHDSEYLCGFCYTQLTDTIQETNGLLTENREPKIPIEELAAITRGDR